MVGLFFTFSDQPKNDFKLIIGGSLASTTCQTILFTTLSGADKDRHKETMKSFNLQSRFMAVSGIATNVASYARFKDLGSLIGSVTSATALFLSFVLESTRFFPVYSLNYILQKLYEVTAEVLPAAEVVGNWHGNLNVPVANATPIVELKKTNLLVFLIYFRW